MTGFSLIELAVVLVLLGIIGILLARWLGIASQERNQALQRTLLQRADDAVTGFAAIQFRLPCPDTNHDGREDCGNGTVGTLPYVTLGLPDARASRIRYGVLRRSGDSTTLAGWDMAANRPVDTSTVLDADLAVLRDRAMPLQVTLNDPDFAPQHEVLPWDNCAHLTTGSGDCSLNPQLHLNSMDFCQAIRNAALLPPSTQYVHTRREHDPGQIAGNVAYALAIIDPLQPAHDASSPTFQSPRRPSGGSSGDNYQDKVLAVGIDQLWTRMRCGDHYAPALYAHANMAVAAGLTTPAMYNHKKQLDIMVELGRAEQMNAAVAIIDASAELINTTSDTLDTIAEIFETYGGWNWRAGIAAGSIGTAVGSVIAAGVAQAAADSYLASVRVNRDQFAARFPSEAKRLEDELVSNARRADILGGFPDMNARNTAKAFHYPASP